MGDFDQEEVTPVVLFSGLEFDPAKRSYHFTGPESPSGAHIGEMILAYAHQAWASKSLEVQMIDAAHLRPQVEALLEHIAMRSGEHLSEAIAALLTERAAT